MKFSTSYVRHSASGLMKFLLILGLAAMSIYRQKPPDAGVINAPLTEFSSARAIKHLEVIAQQPHPVGSAEQVKVRNYIVDTLRAAGLQPEIQQTPVINNIIARLEGTGEGKALLLVGHYDTVPSSPGASDDGSAVAMMLETLRAVKAGPLLRNDVIFLFTDGEEHGLLGAKAFAYGHHWASDVGLVLNFDARGTSGSALMFETSPGNGWLIRQFAQQSPSPLSSSFMPAVYNLLPNHTDFTIFKEAGLPGLNFAFIDGYSNYHSEADNLENVDERSIQHEGSNALALTRHFGNVSLENISASDVIYFDLLGSTMVIYSMRLVLPLTFSVLILFAALVIYGFRKQRLTASGIAQGCLVLILCLGSVWVAVTIIQSIAPSLNTASGTRSDLYMLCLVALALAISFALYALFLREVSLENLTIGGLFWWAMLMLWTSFYLPGASFLFTWPLLFNLIACGLKLISKQAGSDSLLILAAQVFAVIATILILTPAIYTTYVALTLSRAVLVSMLVVPLSVLLIPHFNLELLMNKRRRSGAAVLITPA